MYNSGGGAVGSMQTGTVKSWNGSNGYGFIECPGVAEDVMFLRVALPPDCKEVRGKFLEGKQVQFEVQAGNAGKIQATNIQIQVGEGDFFAGRIKTFSDQNGYGFIESAMLPGSDVRFEKRDFDQLMPGANLKDQLVIFQVATQPDGRQRVSKLMFQSSKIAHNLKAEGGAMAGQNGGMCPYFPQGQCHKGAQCKWSHAVAGQMGGLKRGADAMEQKQCPYFLKGTCQKGDECKWSHATGGSAVSMFALGNGVLGNSAMVGKQCPYFAKGTCQKGDECKWSHSPGGSAPPSFANSAVGKECPYFAKGMCQKGAECKWSHGGSTSSGTFGGAFKKQKAEATSTGQHASGIVKTYSAQKGFGFITAHDVPADVFFMKSDLPVEAQEEDIKGCGVNFELMSMPDGKLRANSITSV